MKFLTIKGRSVNIPIDKYKIDWDQPCRSKIQFELKQIVKPIWQYDDVYEEMIVAGSKLKIDIFNRTKMIAIEFDGEQHQEFNKFFHQNSRANFYKQKMRDTHKNEWMQINNIELIRVDKKTIGSILSLLKPQTDES